MSDAHRPLQLRMADASPVLDFVQTPARSRLRLPMLMLTVLVVAVLALQGGRWWAPTKAAAVVSDKSTKILTAENSGNMPAPAQENESAQPAAAHQALTEKQNKPVVAAMLPARDKMRGETASRPGRRRPAPHAPSRVTVASAEMPASHGSGEVLSASAERREPEPALVMPEVTLRSHVRLTNGALN
ncbi:hypothetical protein [Collimonas pratensis]|uniref:Uncharacterized protein n=1 Tax=Collimonas pratensis TaxID=279113 RepID=A0A127Q9H1_9BURK|nr:hypothetical protein [Collimonas pratensis]AMP06688.1 hypothetical protein CPter91_4378 [Collimonas pratensis]